MLYTKGPEPKKPQAVSKQMEVSKVGRKSHLKRRLRGNPSGARRKSRRRPVRNLWYACVPSGDRGFTVHHPWMVSRWTEVVRIVKAILFKANRNTALGRETSEAAMKIMEGAGALKKRTAS